MCPILSKATVGTSSEMTTKDLEERIQKVRTEEMHLLMGKLKRQMGSRRPTVRQMKKRKKQGGGGGRGRRW